MKNGKIRKIDFFDTFFENPRLGFQTEKYWEFYILENFCRAYL